MARTPGDTRAPETENRRSEGVQGVPETTGTPRGGASEAGCPRPRRSKSGDTLTGWGQNTDPSCLHCGSRWVEAGRCLDCGRATP